MAKTIIAAAGLGEALKSALTEGAALEQSIGGIETLFKDSADTVKQYAENAYQTAGLSANEYMETVTSFSASLLSSMGNDTDAAAEKANMALTDMSDNANKMGTDMESIQNAYQGFAKQNYTMLDNLKLGYGGTQSEMERLLEDAQAISGVEYDISSYADIVDAIHVIQTKMGITGTTASEAATTFSGSLASMQAAAKNVLGYLALGEDIQSSLDALSSTVYTFLVGNMIPMVGNVLSGLPLVVLSLGGDLFSAVSALLPQATSAGVDIINNIAAGLASGIPAFLGQALPMLTQFSGSLRESAGQLVDAGLNLIVQLASGLITSLPTLIENVPLIVTNIAGIINDNAPKLLTTAWNLLVMLGQGLIAAIPTLVANIPQIITAITAVIQAFNWISLGKNIMTLLKNGITGMVSALKGAGKNVLEAIYTAIKALPTKLLSLGKSGGKSLASGIKGMLSAVKSAAGNLLSGVVSAVTTMPSKLLSIGKSAVTKMKSVFKVSEWKNIGK
ncbi:MAG: hypothetical protein LUG65_04365, partial [Clostridiales bacterium]|nr:hypothetical protein [Clostridiales bacterium]